MNETQKESKEPSYYHPCTVPTTSVQTASRKKVETRVPFGGWSPDDDLLSIGESVGGKHDRTAEVERAA